MIIYFSASGNSRATALKMGELLGEKVVSISETSASELNFEGDTFGIVFPIYSWGTPLIVTEYIRNLTQKTISRIADRPCWFICTCGDDTGMAPEMLKKALFEKGLNFTSGWSLQMPNTYVVLPGFDVDSHELEIEKLKRAEKRIIEISDKIKQGISEESYVRGSFPGLKSMIFPLFNKWGINPKKWHSTEACVGCGICQKACPVNNIRLAENGSGPQWGQNCISCLACYNRCPQHAVQYGKITKTKGQYHFTSWPTK